MVSEIKKSGFLETAGKGKLRSALGRKCTFSRLAVFTWTKVFNQQFWHFLLLKNHIRPIQPTTLCGRVQAIVNLTNFACG